MKNNGNWSTEENARRWQRHAQLRSAHEDFGRLSVAVQAAARHLNGVLASLEAAVSLEVGPMLDALHRRKRNDADPLDDFDVQLTLSYGLHPDDREWEDNEENLLCIQTVTLYDGVSPGPGDGFGRPLRDTPWADWSGTPPCWIFAQLMAHSGIAWEDVARIASIQRTVLIKTDQAPILLGTHLVAVPSVGPENT